MWYHRIWNGLHCPVIFKLMNPQMHVNKIAFIAWNQIKNKVWSWAKVYVNLRINSSDQTGVFCTFIPPSGDILWSRLNLTVRLLTELHQSLGNFEELNPELLQYEHNSISTRLELHQWPECWNYFLVTRYFIIFAASSNDYRNVLGLYIWGWQRH